MADIANQTPNNAHAPVATTPIVDADVALAAALRELASSQPIATRVPELKKAAYIFMGLILLAAAQAFVFHGVLVGVLGGYVSDNIFLNSTAVAAWTTGFIGSIVVLTTKNSTLVKTILWIVGLCAVYFLVSDLAHLDVIGAAVDGFIVWYVYHLYQEVSLLQ